MIGLSLFNRTVRARRPARRFVILAAFLGYPLVQIGYSTLVATHRIDAVVWAPLAVALMVLSGVGLITIWVVVRDRGSLVAPHLDERERALTSRAHVLSYGVLASLMVGIGAGIAVALTFFGPVTLRMEDVAPWLIALGVYLPVLPSAALAWIQPDGIEDEVGL